MRIAIFGAGGPTGRLLIDQALTAGHRVTAITRHPASMPSRDGLRTIGADVFDPEAVEKAVTGQDAVLSALGVPAGKAPITTYSHGTAHIITAMRRHGVRRLIVVSSSGVAPRRYSDGGFLFNRVLVPYVTRVLGKTLYDDMRRMEALVRASDLEWTIVRPSGLYDLPAATSYTLTEAQADGRFTARADLAASMLDLMTGKRFAGATVGVVTTVGNPTVLGWLRDNARTSKPPHQA
ncbi:Putative NADH-flavin reductase [Amycolatopsis pretoriensis]|uniref:Putative NADH-flavin reductase n=1 Tax=Amycolatopsis pretoriensis TaxID=218821 RepID=A0A1H5RIW9_9PSEU|nr:SDR family oxidoreductase [Amycolatopsis pretoriensis]SEF37477.1 Putative NADH-flavin reductase [Amycolatopsis pretoriensis]